MIFKNLLNKQSGETKKRDDKASAKKNGLNGWLLCFTFLFLASLICTIIIPIVIWSEYLFEQNQNNGKCSYNYQNGICLANSYCCDGQYAIGAGLCSGSALCCLGDATQCNDPLDNETMWSFESITTITSLVVARNVSEPVVEQAIVIAVSTVEENVYYADVSEIVGKELSATTGQQWLAIVGDRKTFEIFLQQFRAYILITIKDIEIVLIQTSQSRSVNCDQTVSDNDNQTDMFGVDTLPAIDILRNEIEDKTAQNFVTQTIDYVLHSCDASSDSADQTGNYSCVADNVVNELNEQYGGDDWQCIAGSNANELTAKIDYIGGTLFDALFSHTHRIIVYRINSVKQISNKKVMLTARRAAQFNRTLVIANYLGDKSASSDDTPIKLISDAVYHYSNYQLLCDYLVAKFARNYQNNWACVAGRDGQFSRALSANENFIEVNMDYLKVILFQRNK